MVIRNSHQFANDLNSQRSHPARQWGRAPPARMFYTRSPALLLGFQAPPHLQICKLRETTSSLKPHLLYRLESRFAQWPCAFDMMMLMLGITRSLLRCSDALAMRSCTEPSIRPIRISRIGGDQIVHDGIPLFLHCIPNERNRFR